MATSSNLFAGILQNVYIVSKRTFVKNFKTPGGIKYYGFKYFPRDKDFKDPPYDPSPVFLVKRLCKMRGRTKYEKRDLAYLNIDGDVLQHGHINIVKNIPEVNKTLWKVKYLVSITPINFLNGLPEEGDYSGTFLRDNGDFIVSPKLKPSKEQIEGVEKFLANSNIISKGTIQKYLRDKWLNPIDGGVDKF